MLAYIVRRLLLIPPTLLGIMVISFTIIQFVPGGPVEQILAQLEGDDISATERLSGPQSSLSDQAQISSSESGIKYRGAQGIDPEFIKELEIQFGFDKPIHVRFFQTIVSYTTFDFGTSYYRDISVLELIAEKMPTSISLGLWMTLLAYGISIPLGIRKAVQDGSRFDVWSSSVVIIGYAIPGFLFAIMLIILFAGGTGLDWFPLRGLTSENFDELSFFGKVVDYFWHLVLPITAMAVGAFATSTFLTKNSFLEEIRKQYVLTARVKGVSENRVLYGHVFRNAMLIIISGFPGAFVSIFFTGSLLIETIFSLDGLGLLGFESIVNRDYPVVLATLYIFSLIGLIVNLLSDLAYAWVDPRIDFESSNH